MKFILNAGGGGNSSASICRVIILGIFYDGPSTIFVASVKILINTWERRRIDGLAISFFRQRSTEPIGQEEGGGRGIELRPVVDG